MSQRDSEAPLAGLRVIEVSSFVAAPLGGEDAGRRVQAARDVPSGQHVVDRAVEVLRAGREREAHRGVDRVVDRGLAVRPAHDA